MKDYLKKPHEKVEEYVRAKVEILALSYYLFLINWTRKVGIDINSLTADHLLELMKVYEKFKEEEGYIYLRALEDTHIDKLVKLIRVPQEETQERLLAQAFFCIDVRSERFRRHLESLGGYQACGIAGFFGVPVAMVNLQKGHEEFLCPVIVTPRNVVFEVPYNKSGVEKERVASHIFHSVKDHVLAPFVAVEMLGFAFGFDFLGKTLLPEKYLRFKDLAFKDYTKTSLIGRRSITKLTNLDGRVFLHSYDYRVDKKGFLLENILAGPAVVGQWINSEYYFSTVDNEVYGSGSKVYHNVVGRIGVMTGNYSDLRTGLPAQTVLKEGKPFHIPIRYTLIVEAPFELTRNAINKIRKIKDLMQNGWINLLIFDPEKEIFYRYLEGVWVEYLISIQVLCL